MTELKCPSCGSPNVEQIDANKYQCPYCGKTFTTFEAKSFKAQFNNAPDFTSDVSDEPGCLMNGLCFLIPWVGIVLYFVKKETQPKSAKSYLIWAIVGIILSFLFYFILILSDC
jgi:uncharacterized membrane protein YvbJ